jgi:NAD(P)-dependent dehydrogenase (short-subunit alcohol dehydrogenase family)
MDPPSAWVVVGASRGIGLEFVRQLLQQGNQVIAAVRDPITASGLWKVAASQQRPGSCLIEQCDVTSEESIQVCQ